MIKSHTNCTCPFCFPQKEGLGMAMANFKRGALAGRKEAYARVVAFLRAEADEAGTWNDLVEDVLRNRAKQIEGWEP